MDFGKENIAIDQECFQLLDALFGPVLGVYWHRNEDVLNLPQQLFPVLRHAFLLLEPVHNGLQERVAFPD